MGVFVGDVIVKWLSSREMQLLEKVIFIDDNQKEWVAPLGSVIDGASIPRVFWSLIGSPFSGKYRRASVLHDVYCESKTETRAATNKMFYEAMRLDGVNYIKAKTMYLAVKLGAPRWM